MASWINTITDVLHDRSVSVALDAIRLLRYDYSDQLTCIAEHDHPNVHDRVVALTASAAARSLGGAREVSSGEFDVHLTDGWWVLLGRIARDRNRSGYADPQSPVLLHNRSEDLVVYGPAVAVLGRQVIANGLAHRALANN